MKRFSKSSSRNSNKSLTLKPSSKASEFEGKQENGVPRSLSMEHIHNHSNTLGSNKTTDSKLNGSGGIYDTMISSRMASADLLSLSRKKKSSSSVPSTPVPPPSYNNENKNPPFCNNENKHPPFCSNDSRNKEYSTYGDSNVLRNNSNINNISNNNSSNKLVSSPSILDNIENHPFNGTLTTAPYSSAPGGDNTNEMDRSQAEARLCKLRQELDRKRIFIKNMKMSLDTVDSSDNIDIRIQHAELEYQLGKEELNLLNILEEFRNLQNSIENNFKSEGYFHENLSIYNYIIKHCSPSDTLTVHAVQIPYDSKCPKFGLSYRDENHGLYVEWTSEVGPSIGLRKGDRILEINNHLIVQNNNRTELMKLLKLLPQTKLVVLRSCPTPSEAPPQELTPPTMAPPLSAPKPDEAEKIQNDNVRLTHRISYLEEQVAELLQKVNKGQTFHTSGTKLSRTKNKYLETSLCSSKPYETKDSPCQRKMDARHLPEDDEEFQVFQKGNKIKTLLKNQKYAKEKLDKVLEKTKKYPRDYSGDECREESNQRYTTESREAADDGTKDTRHSLSRKYKTLEKCNPSKYHRRKKSETSLIGMTNGTLKSNLSDTETCIPKIKSKSLIYLNKSQSDYNYPLNSLHGSERSIHSLNSEPHDNTLERLSGDRPSGDRTQLYDDEKYRKTFTFPIVKFNSDKNVRKVIDARMYEENVIENSGEGHHRLQYTNSLDRLGGRHDPCYDELNRKLGVCEPDVKANDVNSVSESKENKVTIQTNSNIPHEPDNFDTPCERLARLYVVNETNHSKQNGDRQINNFISDSKEAFNLTNGHQKLDSRFNHQKTVQNNHHPYSTSKISIEFMDKNQTGDTVLVKSNEVGESHQKHEPNNNDLYRIEKAIFNELHEECLSKLDKSQDQRRLVVNFDKNDQPRDNEAKDDRSEQYDDFVRNKQSLDRIYDKYFQEPDSEELTTQKDGKHRFYSKQEILKNKFKNEKYVDIDNDNEIPLSKNVEKLNNNFKEFWKIKSYKKNCSLDPSRQIPSDKIEKSQSETTFNDYERKLIGNNRMYPSPHEESRKFNENTRMSKYELDDKLEKEKLQKAFLSNTHSRSKPIPPKKPARLSLQRAASLQSVNSIASVMTHNSDSQTKKPIKRNYKGDSSYLTVSLQNTSNERWC